MTADPSLPGLAEAPATAEADHKGHRLRLRTRFLEAPEVLPDYELLELLLGIAIPQRDTKPLAKALIRRFGSFADVITAEVEDLKSVDGIKDVAASSLKVVREAAVRLARAPVINASVISNWDTLLDYCRTAMASLPTEQFRLLFLDRKNVLIADELQQTGTVDHTPLYPREVVKRALALHASAVILVHNRTCRRPISHAIQ